MYEQKLSENGKHVDLIGFGCFHGGVRRAAVDGPYSAASAAGTSTTSQLALDGNFDRFDLERFTRKIWEGDTVYFETTCFMGAGGRLHRLRHPAVCAGQDFVRSLP